MSEFECCYADATSHQCPLKDYHTMNTTMNTVPVCALVKMQNLLKRLVSSGEIDPGNAAFSRAEELLDDIVYREMPIECNFSRIQRQAWMRETIIPVDQMIFDAIASHKDGSVMLDYVQSERMCTFTKFQDEVLANAGSSS